MVEEASLVGDRALSQLVVRDSETCDQPDAWSLEIAEEPVLAGVGSISAVENVLGIAVRAAEARVIGLRHVSSITARSVHSYPSALAVISRHGQRHVALTSGQKLAKSTCESWSFGTNPRAP